MWPRAEEVPPVRNRREGARRRIPQPLGVQRRVEAVEHEDLARRRERHVHGHDRPRLRVRSTRRSGSAGRPARRSSRRAGRATQARRATSRAQSAASEGIRRQSRWVFAAFAPHGQSARRVGRSSWLSRMASRRRQGPDVQAGLSMRRGSTSRARSGVARALSRSPRRPRDTLGPKCDPERGHRHEDELEPEGAEDRRGEDVAEGKNRRRRTSASSRRSASRAAARRAAGARGRRRRGRAPCTTRPGGGSRRSRAAARRPRPGSGPR